MDGYRALLTSIVLATLSGFAVNESDYSGPLSFLFGNGGLPDNIHVAFTNLVIVLAVVHVGGVFAHGFISRENLPHAMITGKKSVLDGAMGEDIRSTGIVRSTIALVVGVLAFLRSIPHNTLYDTAMRF